MRASLENSIIPTRLHHFSLLIFRNKHQNKSLASDGESYIIKMSILVHDKTIVQNEFECSLTQKEGTVTTPASFNQMQSVDC